MIDILTGRQVIDKWDCRFMGLATFIATWSKDPSTQAGAVLVRPDKTIASMGFNGFPQRLSDNPKLLAHRESKYKRVIHAEMNALMFLRERAEGYILYTYPYLSCARCAAHMIQAGIAGVMAPICTDKEWRERMDVDLAKALFEEAGVRCLEVTNDLEGAHRETRLQ